MKNPLWKQPGLDRLVIVTVASVAVFIVQIVMSHLTHSLTLLAASYHMLYNILSLAGCIATIKICQRGSSVSNTFGWARLEVLSMVVNLLFLFALDFSLVVEAVQTLIHSDHIDAMHEPEFVCIVSALGIVVNALCTLLIGGFTHHQGSFLALTPQGDVFVPHGAATEDAVRRGLRRLASTERSNDCARRSYQIEVEEPEANAMIEHEKVDKQNAEIDARMTQRWPTMRSVFRDNASSIIALIAALVVYFNGENFTSLIADPLMAILSVGVLGYMSFPFIFQAGQILLQTTPAHIDVGELQAKLKDAFPSVVNIHELHVWALTPDKVISTAHLVFMNEHVYLNVKEPITQFFLSMGITRVTLQPEFYKFGNLTPAPSNCCVLKCNKENCKSMTCCDHSNAHENAHGSPCEDENKAPQASHPCNTHVCCSTEGSSSVVISVPDVNDCNIKKVLVEDKSLNFEEGKHRAHTEEDSHSHINDTCC